MSYKYKQRLEWTETCKNSLEFAYKVYKKLYDDVYTEYLKLFKNGLLKESPDKFIKKIVFERRLNNLQGFLEGLDHVESMFDNILSMSKQELRGFQFNSLINVIIVNEKEWHKEDFYKKIKSKELIEINEHIEKRKKRYDEWRKQRKLQELKEHKEKYDKKEETIVLNLTKEDIRKERNKEKK